MQKETQGDDDEVLHFYLVFGQQDKEVQVEVDLPSCLPSKRRGGDEAGKQDTEDEGGGDDEDREQYGVGGRGEGNVGRYAGDVEDGSFAFATDDDTAPSPSTHTVARTPPPSPPSPPPPSPPPAAAAIRHDVEGERASKTRAASAPLLAPPSRKRQKNASSARSLSTGMDQRKKQSRKQASSRHVVETSRPKDAKVWNKALAAMIADEIADEKDKNKHITSFLVPRNHAQRGKDKWEEAREKLMAEGAKEVYVLAGNKIIGLPNALGASIRNFCERAILGDPTFYLSKKQCRYLEGGGRHSISIGTTSHKRNTDGDIIEKMQRGGPFALLMVFHYGDGDDGSSAATHTTKEAQDKMRTMMGGHDVAPRIEGLNGIKIDAWIENIRTLTKHGLIKRTKNGEKTKLRRMGGQDTFELTNEGRIFLKALINRRGDEIGELYPGLDRINARGVEQMKDDDLMEMIRKRRRLNQN